MAPVAAVPSTGLIQGLQHSEFGALLAPLVLFRTRTVAEIRERQA